MRKKVKVTKKLAAAGLAAILACQVMGCGTGEKPTKDVSDEKVSEVKSQDTSKKEVYSVSWRCSYGAFCTDGWNCRKGYKNLEKYV